MSVSEESRFPSIARVAIVQFLLQVYAIILYYTHEHTHVARSTFTLEYEF